MRWLLALALFLAPVSVDAATLLVSTSGNDSANCVSMPCKTPQRASDLANPGDTVLVQDGTYPGFTVAKSGGPASDRIVFKAQNTGKARLTGQIKSYGKSHIVINGFDLKATSGNIGGNGIDIRGVGTDIAVTYNAIYSTSESCIAAWGDPWQTDPGRNNYRGLTDVRIVGNKAIKCNNGGSNEMITAANGVDGLIIDSNEVGNNPGDYGSTANGGELIDLKAGVSNAKITSNHLHDGRLICIYADGAGALGYYAQPPVSRNIEIAYNRIVNCNNTAIQLSTEASGFVDGVSIHDNTIETTNHIGLLVYRHPSASTWAKPHGPGCVKNAVFQNNKVTNAKNGVFVLNSPCSTGIVNQNNGPNVTPGTPTTTPPEPPVEPPVTPPPVTPDPQIAELKARVAALEAQVTANTAENTRLVGIINQAKSILSP